MIIAFSLFILLFLPNTGIYRLGLGAVPPQDPDTHVYNSKLEKRIKRKLLGKRSRDDDDDAVGKW